MRLIRMEDYKGEPLMGELTPEQLVEARRLAKESFTAADLQKYTEDEPMVPIDLVLQEMEDMIKRHKEPPS